MAKIDKVKEHIGTLKSYMNIIVALILTFGAGVSKLYLSSKIGIMFWMGIFSIILFIVIFIIISKNIHKNINKLEEL